MYLSGSYLSILGRNLLFFFTREILVFGRENGPYAINNVRWVFTCDSFVERTCARITRAAGSLKEH